MPPEPTADAITRCITTLVQQAPALDAAVVDELIDALRRQGSRLALAIARIVELVGDGLVAQGIALPHLAMACATLVDPALDEATREAARYEIDTLQPVPDAPPGMRRPTFAAPDVPIDALSRGPRRRT